MSMSKRKMPVRDKYWRGRRAWDRYVYALADPRSGEIFYYGSGRADRLLDHDREASLGVMTPKCIRIREIRKCGLKHEARIVGLFSSKQAAVAFELELIKSARPGQLTNFQGILPEDEWVI